VARKRIVEGIRITKIGLFYILLTLLVGVAAANTGNNALYIVEALLLALLVLSGITSRRNLAKVDVELRLPLEAHANQPFTARLRVTNRDRWMSCRLVVIEGVAEGEALLVPVLARRAEVWAEATAMVARRGRYRVSFVHLASVFPFGFFRKGVRLRQDAEMLVFPQLFAAARDLPAQAARSGAQALNQRGGGHELFNLRRFQSGDDRRGIHWKQTARTGQLIYMEREAEAGSTLTIVLDNAVGELTAEVERQRFETLVSEAATAADEALKHGLAVELRTRDMTVPRASGPGQRHRVMTELALVEPRARTAEPLAADPREPQLRLALEGPPAGARQGSDAA
jgi:uncharacterized protein (DUF58 family)